MGDRDEIFDVAVRYATALDTRNWDLLRTCFLPDVVGRYLQSQHRLNSAEGGPLFTLAGRDTDLFRRTDEGWKIAERELETMWVDGNPAVLAHVL
jgi:hypothetical protein